jgi:hypothetical protein
MIKAACHCGAVRFELKAPPHWVMDCNCTICRRYGALWAYPHAGQADIVRAPDPQATAAYLWGERSIAFHHCRSCGCITHMEGVDGDPPPIFGINARMIVGLNPAHVQVRQVDNGHNGFFWTRSDEPVLVSRHPPMPPPGPDDWR